MRGSTLVVTIPGGVDGEDGVVVATDAIWSPDYADLVTAAGGENPSITVSPGSAGTRGPDDVVHVLVAVSTWAATSATWDVTKALGAAIARRLRSRHATESSLTEDQATDCARWVIEQRHDEARTGLVLEVSDLGDDGTAEIVLTSDTGWEYTCHLEGWADGVRMLRLRRTRLR